MKVQNRVKGIVTSLLFAAIICLSSDATADMNCSEREGSTTAGLDSNSDTDPLQSLEDLVNLGQPEGKKPLENCNKKAPGTQDKAIGKADCTIQESAGKIVVVPILEVNRKNAQ
jgi:hypothetical protein